MGMWVEIPWVEVSIYHGYVGRYAMRRGLIYHG